jgi:serine/threonine protein kinase
MKAAHPREEEIFLAALECTSPQERDAYVVEACQGDGHLLQRVQELLSGHDASVGPLDAPLPAILATEIRTVTEQPGDTIGPYKLLQQIGEGGFGVVYMAEQTKPVRRKVALKIIKPGMDTKEVIARFEAERQALALMDHPNIAKVLDGGTTETGRPYFVMELVKGIPITKFCDENKLETHPRLKLFISVCRAIQHAHQKGVIHRDIKPSNVLVTLHDGEPVPRVIDFGVAKAISQQLTEKTMFTAFGQMIGTPQYMSPEQAEMSGLDVDTRSDIYSLGVLLYELLTGSTPLDPVTLRETAFQELQRMIREEEPQKPSTRLTTLGEQSAWVASNRGTSADKLGTLLRGDLDWVVMRSLEKNRERRYDTANALAADIARFLQQEPVEACPPSTFYKFRKFARRNKAAIGTATAITASLIVGFSLATWQAIVATRERDRVVAERERAEALLVFLNDFVFRKAIPLYEEDSDVSLRTIMENLPTDEDEWPSQPPLVEASIRHYVGVTCHLLALPQQSRIHLERAWKIREKRMGTAHIETARTQLALATCVLHSGWRTGNLLKDQIRQFSLADELATAATETMNRELGEDHPESLKAACLLSLISHFRGDQERAMQIYRRIEEPLSGLDERDMTDQVDLVRSIGMIIRMREVGFNPEVNRIIETNYAKAFELPRYHLHRLFWTDFHGALLLQQGKLEEADKVLDQALIDHLKVLHPKNNFIWLTNRIVCILRIRQEKWSQAIDQLEKGRVARPDEPGTMLALGVLRLQRDAPDDRREWLELSKELLEYHQQTDHPELAYRTVMLSLAAAPQTDAEREMQEKAIVLARRFTSVAEEKPPGVLKDPDLMRPSLLFIRALAEYRADRWKNALEYLDRVDEEDSELCRALALACRAAIERDLGHPDDSRTHWEDARALRSSLPPETRNVLWDLMPLLDLIIGDASKTESATEPAGKEDETEALIGREESRR